MTIQSQSLDALERDFWITRAEVSQNTPFNEAKRLGMIAYVPLDVPSNMSTNEVEKMFLKEVITSNGQTPQSERIPDLWLQFADSEGVDITNRTWREAKYEWFNANQL